MNKNRLFSVSGLIAALFLIAVSSNAQGIKGIIKSTIGEPLPFATIYVRNIETGTTSNGEGQFMYHLPSGKYDLVFQYLGYSSVVRFVEVGSGFTEINIELEPRTIVLKDVEINAGKEDPAYTIMRKAIAKAKYHRQQLDSYTAQVYIKGSGRLIDSPFFLRKQIAKEGIDSTSAFVTESITEVKYTRPNTYEEKVISMRSDGNDNNTSPIQYITSSFYEPKVVNAISPLSPKAFGYYRFIYMGTFREEGYDISKIQVIPRSKGDDLFEGELYIVEELWSIHSLDFKTSYLGIEIRLEQICNPIENEAWMPVSHHFDIYGTFFGFEFEYNYLATVSDYDIELNEDLVMDFVVIDEKVEKELAKELEEQNKDLNLETLKKLDTGKELTRKEMRKLMREYESMEMERDTMPDVAYVNNVTIDSLAYKMDSTYWQTMRPVPLSEYEIKGYHKMDSMSLVNKNEAEGDTIKTKKGKEGFKIYDLVLGNTYKVGDKAHLKIKNPLININFNTVEGYNFYYQLAFTKTFENKSWLELQPTFRYGFSSKQALGTFKTTYQWSERSTRKSLVLDGGKYVSQINSNIPILPIINSLTTLMLESNYLKIYDQEYISLQYNHKISNKYRFSLSAEYANRSPFSNNTSHTWFSYKDKEYTLNAPTNVELGNTDFISHEVYLGEIKFSMKPWVKYYIRNKEKIEIKESSPEFRLTYNNALPLGSAEVSYHKMAFDVTHFFDIGVRGKLSYRVGGGGFISKENLTFLDYNHFMGNRTPFQDIDVVKNYRLLPYYYLSTSDAYVNMLTYYQFRKLFLSRFKFLRKRGIKESVFVNYLGTNTSQNYTEVGYSIENIFRLFRLEGVASFQDGQYQDWGIRFGMASYLSTMFQFN